ncbi:MAG: dihydropteroate synthase [Pseudomonadota bacterium]
MQVILGFGSNHGDRHHWLREGIRAMQRVPGLTLQRVSPVVESPALLPAGSPWDWNRPFLNCVATYEHEANGTVESAITRLREHIDAAQAACGRPHPSRWAPRPLDIDVLLFGEEQRTVGRVTVPHPDLLTRNFVLSPLAAICPELRIPGDTSGLTALAYSRALPHHIPLWMGVLNITPDSFSDGGKHQDWEAVKGQVQRMREHGVHLLDLGAESTRPGAEPLDAQAEWARLATILLPLVEFLGDDPLRPLISVDTYHASVASRAIEAGVQVINDVSGLEAPGMLEVAVDHPDTTVIAMHNLGVPADRAVTLPGDSDPYQMVRDWILRKLETWSRAGLASERTVIDPGIGFGKDALQSLRLLRSAGELGRLGVRLLVGHSRKSFMKSFSEGPLDSMERDLITTGASLNLSQQGVDIIRVHNVPMHTDAYRGWSHLVAMPLPPAERSNP